MWMMKSDGRIDMAKCECGKMSIRDSVFCKECYDKIAERNKRLLWNHTPIKLKRKIDKPD